jgi:hypothetical protein
MINNTPQPTNNQFILYQDDNGITNVNVRFDGRRVADTTTDNRTLSILSNECRRTH